MDSTTCQVATIKPLGESVSQGEWEARERARVLRELDERPFGWFHIKTIIISGVGFFTDAYDIFIINLVVPMIGYCYWTDHKNKVPTIDSTMMKGGTTIGTFIGQLAFGLLGDYLGRKKIYGVELLIMILCTMCTSMSCTTHGGVSITVMLSLWRLGLGFGIGGDYPLSAVLTSEYSSKNRRGMMIGLVFAMQGIGILFGAIVSCVLLGIFKARIEESQRNIDHVWRLCLLIGVVPAACALYFRTRVPESPRYTMEVEQNLHQATRDIEKLKTGVETDGTGAASSSAAAAAASKHQGLTWAEFRDHFSQWHNLGPLIGAALSWFLLDIAWYGLGLNQSIVIETIGFGAKNARPWKDLMYLAAGNAVVAVMGTVPGYFITCIFVEKWGRKPIQLMGFAMLTIIFVILTSAYYELKNNAKPAFAVLYALAQLFFNFGPNTTTFIIPGELFPTRMRSTGHGICAATGKLGAIIAAYGFQPIVDNARTKDEGIRTVLAIFSGVMFLGILTTLLIPETKGLTLEDLAAGNHGKRRATETDKLKQSPATSPAVSPTSSPYLGAKQPTAELSDLN
eukprot:m51a1_g1835 putative mfs phs inorganic phosphate transporter (568) ;mRNA; f:550901-552741